MQQLPNPLAQVPDENPPYLEHSKRLKQVPLSPFSPTQGSLGNRTKVGPKKNGKTKNTRV